MSQNVDTKIAAWCANRAKIRSTRTKMGLAGYAYLTAILKRAPITSQALQQMANMQHSSANRFLMTMHTLKRAHITRWDEPPRKAFTPVFAYGPGTDAEPPAVRKNGRRIDGIIMPRKRVCSSVIPLLRMMDALQEPHTLQELSDAVGAHRITVREGLKAMLDLEMAHLPYWDWDKRPLGGGPVATYLIGAGPITRAPKIRKRDRAVVRQRWEQSKRQFTPLLRAFSGNEPERQAA